VGRALGARRRWESVSVIVVTKDLIDRLNAGDLIKAMPAEVAARRGGPNARPEENPAMLDGALERFFGLVERMLQRTLSRVTNSRASITGPSGWGGLSDSWGDRPTA